MSTEPYKSEYTDSWALVIGIDDYEHVTPLQFACNDAEAVSKILIERFGFLDSNVVLLTNEAASRDSIMEAFLEFAKDKVGQDDRILVFFAGHGYTRTGLRGEVGYLVPVHGRLDEPSSLIRWDELTRNADLIPAKHVFFVMDACYGGLALTRGPSPGSMRFLKDMLRRLSRQVLTAGKADEVVADSGGPLPDHSLFTGHFLQALEGKAAARDGTITANTVMAYVYEKVSRDQYSRQTPHFGFLAGDGDFVLEAPALGEIPEQPEIEKDILFELPSTIGTDTTTSPSDQSVIDTVKDYLSDARYRIRLDDLITQQLRRVLSLTTDNDFPVRDVRVTPEELSSRLKRYESIVHDLQAITVLLAHWGVQEHTSLLRKIITRVTDNRGPENGTVAWLDLRWYPATLLMYSGGIGAIAAANYENLATILTTPVHSEWRTDKQEEFMFAVVGGLFKFEGKDMFRMLPDHERLLVARSEYLFKILQPDLEDILFLGRDYEAAFDRFEMFLALVHTDLRAQRGQRVWGPPGRFAWKHQSGHLTSAFAELVAEADREQDDWPPLKAGLFGASHQRFGQVSAAYLDFMGQLPWP